MKKALVGLLCLSWLIVCQHAVHAASTVLSWDGTGGLNSNSLSVDDSGGSESNYNFVFNGDNHTSTTDFIVSDGSGIAVGAGVTSDFTGNGLSQFAGPFANLPNVDQLVLETDAPFTPITMSVNNTNLSLEEVVYVNNTKDYAIIELRAVNQGAAATPVFISIANDWDINVNSGGGNDAADFDAARNLVFQQETDGNYSIGMASLNNPVDQFHIGGCCGLTDVIDVDAVFPDAYAIQRHFLNGSKPTEECDDGGDDPADGGSDTCSAKCHAAVAGQVCGNNTVEGDEECDDGNLTAGDGCDHRCLDENGACGNGSIDSGEECDDNNRFNGDSCDVDCKVEFAFNDSDFCGDGVVNNGATGNQIDPSQFPNYDAESALSVKFASVAAGQGATAAFCIIGATGTDLTTSQASLEAKTDDCLAFYQQNIAVCGNSIQNAGEDCDDGNTVDNDGCDSNCTVTGCGNGIVNPAEACDDGNLVNGDGCDDACEVEGICGDSVIDDGEECDDGNDNNSDSCTNLCASNDALLQGSACSLSSAGGSGGKAPFLASALLLAVSWLAVRRRLAQ